MFKSASNSLILRGALAPGEKIVEEQLCADLGISRAPLREARQMPSPNQDSRPPGTARCLNPGPEQARLSHDERLRQLRPRSGLRVEIQRIGRPALAGGGVRESVGLATPLMHTKRAGPGGHLRASH